ncbi:hypothetical protein SLEP1_g42407 [Rubroshorea leprosula]|uniref:Uncharacterized protein n=1 Tax=Rubroshorea leprosula TaxID=152421 RepID=A0AAV5L9P1_9ROSI|nr:hypothetical protein SLEP1_g42407 [Rubroshorea leprosula]
MSSCRFISCSVDCHIGAGSIFAAAGSGCRRGAAQRKGCRREERLMGKEKVGGVGCSSKRAQAAGGVGCCRLGCSGRGGGVGSVAEERKD